MATQREQRHAATREEIMAVARGVMIEDGYTAFSLREVARRCGLGVASLYTYFPGKPALVTALADDALSELDERLARAGRDAAPGGRLVALGVAYLAFAHDDPAALACLTGAAQARGGGDAAGAGRSLREVVVRHFSAALQEGFALSAPPGAPAPTHGALPPGGGADHVTVAALGLFALVHGLAVLGLDRGRDDRRSGRDDEPDAILTTFVSLVQAP
jgi:AcrR family transcriptional regulator